MVKSELDFVYITSDGRRFLNKQDAILHEQLSYPKYEGVEDAEQE